MLIVNGHTKINFPFLLRKEIGCKAMNLVSLNKRIRITDLEKYNMNKKFAVNIFY